MLMCVVGISISMAQAVGPRTAASKKMKPMSQSLVVKQAKDIKTQTMSFSPLALNKEEKIISSVSRGDKQFQLVRNENGTFNKKVVLNNKTQKLNRKTPALRSQKAEGYTLFESFEGWDGEEKGWTPDGWSRDNKTESTTWEMSEGGFIADPTDGDYMAWVNLGMTQGTEGEIPGGDPRNEMLISPAFTPLAGENLYFDISFAALWMFLDFNIFDFTFDDPVFNIEVLVSEDNGTNWKSIYNIAEAEDLFDYEALLDYEYMENEWYSIKLSMASYVGKSIKIAFQYYDRDGGDNIGLDYIRVCEPEPKALYRRPQGYFYAGLNNKGTNYLPDLLVGNAYTSSVWKNLSKDAETYSWKFENPDESGTMITVTDKNPDVIYPFNLFEIPALTASAGGKSSTYQWGSGDGVMAMLTGGDLAAVGAPGFGVGNYDLFYDFYYYTSSKGYLYGTTSDNSIEGVANFFEKPAQKYILNGMWAYVYQFSFPAETEFTMVIHRIDEDGLSGIIAKSTCKASDVVNRMMPFAGFITIDPETGLEIENDYIEIEDAILVEIKGFNNIPGGSIAFVNQEFNTSPVDGNNAYIFLANGRLTYYLAGATSLLFTLDITYSYLLADSNEFIAPVEGGEKTFNVTSFYSPDDWWLEEDYPDWISDDIVFDENTWEIKYTLKAAPLPANVTYREAVIKVVTYGADMSIKVTQGVTGIRQIVTPVAETKVTNKGNHFELTYSPDYSAVSVYNVAGQKVAGYPLPSSGLFTVPTGNYPQGIYLISFSGTNGTSTVKVLK